MSPLESTKAAGALQAAGAHAAAGAQALRELLRSGAATVGAAFATAAAGRPADLLPLRELCRALVAALQSPGLPVLTIAAPREQEGALAAHAVNVAVLGAAQASALDLGPEVAEQVALCGLLHDLGKARLPEALVTKRGPLSDTERSQLAGHTLLGARLLFGAEGAGHAPPLVALEHHGTHNPSRRAHLYSQLVAIADAWDALRSLRPFEPESSNPGIYGFMDGQLRGRFHPLLLGRFGRLLGVLPTGALAALDSGELCRVLQESAGDPLRPQVEVVDTARGLVPVGQQLDLAEGPRRLAIAPHAAFGDVTVQELDDCG